MVKKRNKKRNRIRCKPKSSWNNWQMSGVILVITQIHDACTILCLSLIMHHCWAGYAHVFPICGIDGDVYWQYCAICWIFLRVHYGFHSTKTITWSFHHLDTRLSLLENNHKKLSLHHITILLLRQYNIFLCYLMPLLFVLLFQFYVYAFCFQLDQNQHRGSDVN